MTTEAAPVSPNLACRAVIALLLGAATAVVVAWCGWNTWTGFGLPDTNGFVSQGSTGAWWCESSGWAVTEREIVLALPGPLRGPPPRAPILPVAGGEGELAAPSMLAQDGAAAKITSAWSESEPGARMSAGGWGAAPGTDSVVVSHAAGWPWRAVWSYKSDEAHAQPVGLLAMGDRDGWSTKWYERIQLPYLPVWRGLAAGSAFYGTLWFCALSGTAGALQARRRRRSGRCASCGYELSGLPRDGEGGVTCPECGRRAVAVRVRRS